MTETLHQIVDDTLAEAARLDPCAAVLGAGADRIDGLTDYSPDGHAARADAARRALDRLLAADGADPVAAHLEERLRSTLAMLDAGEPQRELNAAITGPLQTLAHTVTAAAPAADATAERAAEGWEQALLRLRALPEALNGYATSLREAAARGHVAAIRQIEGCASRCAGWSRMTGDLLTRYGDGPLQAQMRSAVYACGAAYARFETFLRTELAPRSVELAVPDAFGPDRYPLWVRHFLGADPDLAELYEWGWDEVRGIEAAMRAEADRLVPGADVAAAVEWLDRESPSQPTAAAFDKWLQRLLDDTMDRLNGTHFDVPAALRRLETRMLSDTTTSYAPPSTDMSRPGRVSWSLDGPPPYPQWWTYSVAYHEGTPGHHLHIGLAAMRGDEREWRLEILGGRAAAFEGWALYAETLMDEIGAFEAPGARLGYLASQMLRAARIVMDIGLHLGLRLPQGSGLGADGEIWSPEIGSRMLVERCLQTSDTELLRYLGRPGQALAYKSGERVFREVRDATRERLGDAFDPRAFHAAVLAVPPAGLNQLAGSLARATAALPAAPAVSSGAQASRQR